MIVIKKKHKERKYHNKCMKRSNVINFLSS